MWGATHQLSIKHGEDKFLRSYEQAPLTKMRTSNCAHPDSMIDKSTILTHEHQRDQIGRSTLKRRRDYKL